LNLLPYRIYRAVFGQSQPSLADAQAKQAQLIGQGEGQKAGQRRAGSAVHGQAGAVVLAFTALALLVGWRLGRPISPSEVPRG